MTALKIERLVRRRPAPEGLLRTLPANMHPVLQRVYAARRAGADELEATLSRMIPVSVFAGTTAVAARLVEARERQQRVLILGDYDADGATATALCVGCLRAMGFDAVDYLVPDRVKFGYGLSVAIADEAAKRRPDLIVTVDNGISSIAGVARANQHGIDVLVTDHHLPGAELPAACAIVNPNLDEEPFPSKCLAGVGVAFYVLAALGRLLAERDLLEHDRVRSIVASGLDLVALGTVADLVPLDYNNRILVAEGLSRIRAGRARPGIRALFTVAGRNFADAASGELAFQIAPRLNAAGRLDDMSLGIDCLLAGTDGEALRLAQRLDALNDERKVVQAQMEAEARDHVARAINALDKDEHDAWCLFDTNWHEGIVGLVASRIKDRIARPVVAFARSGSEGLLKGSARSIRGIHVRDVIDAVAAAHPELVVTFGGHAMAAGLTIGADKLDAFRAAFEAEVGRFGEALKEPDVIWTDGELTAGDLSLELAEALRSGGPWGQGFPEPLFENVLEVVDSRVLRDAHLKLTVCHPDGGGLTDAIAFNSAQFPDGYDGKRLRFVYRLDVNEFRNRRTAQLVVEHMQSA